MPVDIEEFEITSHKKVSTGIIGLDYQLGGGFPEGCITVIQGSAVSGIEKIAEQFWKADEKITGSDDSWYLISDNNPSVGMTPVTPDEMGDALSEMHGKRYVVDSLSGVILKCGVDAAISLIKNNAGMITQDGGNILFLLYDDVHSPADEISVIRYADIYIHLIEERHGNEIERKMEIGKIKNANVPSRLFPYNITEEGIDLSTTARVV
jgi:KaiC/GvpD/RAD55 family RecA-like ATPase